MEPTITDTTHCDLCDGQYHDCSQHDDDVSREGDHVWTICTVCGDSVVRLDENDLRAKKV